MNIDAILVPSAMKDTAGRTLVIIDVLRATTTIATALSHGCAGIIPVEKPDEAFKLAGDPGRAGVLIGGERKGYRIEGFDLGNSPAEYTPDAVAGRTVILCTTNGTRIMEKAAGAGRIYLAALVNAPAVAARLSLEKAPASLICAGREDSFSLEDALCAGLIASKLLDRPDWEGTDGARAAAALWRQFGGEEIETCLSRTDHGAYLASIGLAGDISLAARVGACDLVPVLRDGCITAG